MADRLGLVALIDHHCPASRRSLSIGTTLGLAALNRAVWPCSKRAWATWAQRTSVHRLFDIAPDTLTSQYFWAQMDAVSGVALEAIEADLTRQVVHDFQLQLDTLFYDTSNFFTYLASGNERSTLAQRGHSKQKRFDLRQFSLALLVTRDGQIPLSADVYEGNTVDATRFPTSLTAIRQRVEDLVGHLAELTLVYDKGNKSKANQALVDALPVHYVASLVPSQHLDLTAIPTTAYTPLGSGPLAKLPVYRPAAQFFPTAGAKPGAPPTFTQTARHLAAVATDLGQTAQRTADGGQRPEADRAVADRSVSPPAPPH
jgi:transposase